MRCENKDCRKKFKQRYFLEKTCSKECEKVYREDTPIKNMNKVSKRTSELNREYLYKRDEFLKGKICPVTNNIATELHHMNGRTYERLLDQKYWLAVSRQGHAWIHSQPKEAREKGWLI